MKKKKIKHYDNIKWIDARKASINDNDKTTIQKFVNDNYYSFGIKNPDYNRDKKEIALNVIISNAIDEYTTGKYIAIPHSRGYYQKLNNNNPDHNTFAYMVGATKALVNCDYLEKLPGFFNQKNEATNLVTRIRAKQKLLDEVKKCIDPQKIIQNYYDKNECITYTFIAEEFSKIKFDNIVELKDGKKNLIDYRPNIESERSRKFLREYNAFIKTVEVKIPIDKITRKKQPLFKHNYTSEATTTNQIEYNYTSSIPLIGFSEGNYRIYKNLNCQLKRVFNDSSFNKGGRFYDADYQKLSKAERSNILINGNTIVEIDYRCFHPRMLYHELGIDEKGDIYMLGMQNVDLREAIKKMLNILINAKSDYNAYCGFEKYLNKDQKGLEIADALKRNKIGIWELIEMIKSNHKAIEKFIGKGVGKDKQYKDSILAIRIMKHFLNKKLACLCVHDSFIVEEKYKEELYDLMMNEYKKMFAFYPELQKNEKKEAV